VDENIATFIDLVQVAGEPGKEGGIADHIRRALMAMGVPPAWIVFDEAHTQSEYGGEVGNMIVRLDGHGRGERRMLSTHLDTVPTALGSKPRLAGDRVVNDAAGTALGADARAGCAVLLGAARALLKRNGNHPPRTLVFFVLEEVGLVGSRGLDTLLLGDPFPSMAFNFDGGDAEAIANAVIGTERLNVTVTGVAAHGSNPEKGISAVVIAAHALANLDRGGWNGRVEKPEGRGTANLGIIRGGKGSNVVMPDLYGLAEARSHDLAFRRRIIQEWRSAFTRAVDEANAKAREAEGRAAVAFAPGPVYDPYRLPDDAPAVQAAMAAVRRSGLEPRLFCHDGGMDTNHIVATGIPAVGMGMGDRQGHAVEEWLDVPHFLKACEIAVHLALAE
jgi:tripeptide aminopeptidase